MWIPAEFESRVDKINFLPGATVHPNEVIMVLSEPDMELAAADRANGLHDAPWPPEYPKQPDEPPRVAPSRAKAP